MLPKLSNSSIIIGLQFSSRCRWCRKKRLVWLWIFISTSLFVGVFQCMDCRLVSTSNWNIQVSSQVMILLSIQALHLTSRERLNDELLLRDFWHQLRTDFRNVKFFWQFLYRRLQFHWFWPLFAPLKRRQVDLDIGHCRCSLGLQNSEEFSP